MVPADLRQAHVVRTRRTPYLSLLRWRSAMYFAPTSLESVWMEALHLVAILIERVPVLLLDGPPGRFPPSTAAIDGLP